MKTRQSNKMGFTMVELLVVLVIIGILAAVATPIFLGNTKKAKASEAVATMSLIRQAQRDYYINNNAYITKITKGDIDAPLPKGVDLDTGITQYFANDAFTVVSAGLAQAPFEKKDSVDNSQAIPAQDFVVRADGKNSVECSTNATEGCALKRKDVEDFVLEMDNTGRTYVSYDSGSNWQKF